MNVLRCWGFVLALGLALVGPARGEDRGDRSERGARPPEGAPARVNVVPLPGAVEKLKLTAEQKEKVKELEKEFGEKHRDALRKMGEELKQVQEDMQKARADGDAEAARKAQQRAAEVMKGGEKLREQFEEQFTGILTDEQKKDYAEMKRQLAAAPRVVLPPGMMMINLRESNIALLLPPVQEKLGLSDRQKDQIGKLGRDFNARLLEVLTDDQQQEFKDWKSHLPRLPTPLPERRPETRPDGQPGGRSGASGGVNVPAGVRVLKDLEYSRPDDKPQLLDLYLPKEAEGRLPVILWVHGGGWTSGDKNGGPALFMAGRGYAVASINYRLSQEATFPAQIEDCKAAVRWLRANAEKYHLDPERIGAWGASAGGHLVALLGTTGATKRFDRGDNLEYSSRVQAVCDWFGPTDLRRLAGESRDARSPVTRLLGGPVAEHEEKAAAASPVIHVAKGDPPFLIIHGDQDHLVPLDQSERLEEALKQAGAEVKLHVVKGAGHGFGGPEVKQLVEDFFDRHLKPQPVRRESGER